MADHEKEAIENLQIQVKYGHCLVPIMKNACEKVHWPSFAPLYEQLCKGTFLNDKTLWYWFDKVTKSNAYIMYARSLSIAWGKDTRYWKWITVEHIGKQVQVAELIEVCWLDVIGKMKEFMLSPGKTYEVYFHLLLRSCHSGFCEPLLFSIKCPNGLTIVTNEVISNKPTEQWFQIKAGEFKTDVCGCDSAKEYEFSMCNKSGEWKRGLVVKCVEIRPKKPSCG